MPISFNKEFTIVTLFETKPELLAIAGLYFYYALDCLVDLARGISVDFIKRPNRYTNADLKDVADGLGKLRAAYGSDPSLPSKQQREDMYGPIFGHHEAASTDSDDFARGRDELLQAVTAFTERKAYKEDPDAFRRRVISAHETFKDYLEGFKGVSVTWSVSILFHLTEETSYPIFRNAGIRGVFWSGGRALKDEWPYLHDSNGAREVEEISKQLASNSDDVPRLTSEHFSILQRVAAKGTEAIVTILEVTEKTEESDIDGYLIPRCYAWSSALNDLRRWGLPSTGGLRQSPVRMHH